MIIIVLFDRNLFESIWKLDSKLNENWQMNWWCVGTGSNGQVNGGLSSIPSPTMPSFGLAPAATNSQNGPGAPDPTSVYNGLAQAYPARELTNHFIAQFPAIPLLPLSGKRRLAGKKEGVSNMQHPHSLAHMDTHTHTHYNIPPLIKTLTER